MKKVRRTGRPSAYEVALAKGDLRLPKDVLRHDPFEDDLDNFITFWKFLGRPGTKTLYHLLMWSDHQRNRKEAASAIGLSGPGAVRKMLKRLQMSYQKNKERFSPHH
ncbi:MAG: hypothetical protein HY762_09315 [Planctomycetes bacterium]|nr:hypothetical protein [Planctomycetota bacterium]